MADDKGDNVTIKINEADLLALLGENGEHWVKGAWGDDDRMCLHGAIRRCQPVPGDAAVIEQVAAMSGWGTSWNDAEDTSWADVRARLAHIEVTDEDLADTFGPQWMLIVALVRRAAIMTDEEKDRLAVAWTAAGYAAWAAAWDAAWDAAWVAAGAAARNAARNAAWVAAGAAAENAARNAAWNAAQVAAGAAALALSVRDLIGQYGLTQEHYDLLTGPWATVIGPVHPDDEARRG